jgi:hypothetical protein
VRRFVLVLVVVLVLESFPSRVLEYWNIGVLRFLRIEPRRLCPAFEWALEDQSKADCVPKRQCLTVLTFDRIYVKVRMEKSWEGALVLIPPKIAVHPNLAKAFRHRVAAGIRLK